MARAQDSPGNHGLFSHLWRLNWQEPVHPTHRISKWRCPQGYQTVNAKCLFLEQHLEKEGIYSAIFSPLTGEPQVLFLDESSKKLVLGSPQALDSSSSCTALIDVWLQGKPFNLLEPPLCGGLLWALKQLLHVELMVQGRLAITGVALLAVVIPVTLHSTTNIPGFKAESPFLSCTPLL